VAEQQSLAEWLAYLERLHPTAIELGLARVAEVRRRLALDPMFPIITVGGTNGKGSTCAMLESILHAAGYRVGCYTSPHILEYNERVRIGKQAVGDAELCAAFAKIEQARRELPEISLTYFEFGTLAAMQCFIGNQVEVAILEVGLGGRLDAVNAFDADCALVCSVDLDHTDYLGDTREKIAFEKTGIFRKDRVAVFGDPDMPVMIAEQAEEIGAKLWRAGKEFGFDRGSPASSHPPGGGELMQWNYHGVAGARNALPYPALRGAYQLNNASAALAALDALRDKLPVNMDAVRRGLAEVVLPGRFQVIPGIPSLILDVAHNPHAARALAQNLATLPPARTFAVFAMLRDKDMAGVAHALDSQVDFWMVAGIDAPRGATAMELAQVLRVEGVRGAIESFSSPADALRHASIAASENDRIVAFGSFYTVADVMRAQIARRATAA
jgi:dihydrofolate synthase/folylpolyglutamate synthase